MDGWKRLPLVNTGAVQYIQGLLAGTTVYAVIRGQVQGPYTVDINGKVDLTALELTSTTWRDGDGKLRAEEVYAGQMFDTHRWTSLPLEGGNPVGTSQNKMSRKAQLYVRFVDSYLPKVNGTRAAERGPEDKMDLLGSRVTGDRRATELNFQRAAVVDVVMDKPLRMEVSAIFGGVREQFGLRRRRWTRSRLVSSRWASAGPSRSAPTCSTTPPPSRPTHARAGQPEALCARREHAPDGGRSRPRCSPRPRRAWRGRASPRTRLVRQLHHHDGHQFDLQNKYARGLRVEVH
jgi:hypothetical protein